MVRRLAASWLFRNSLRAPIPAKVERPNRTNYTSLLTRKNEIYVFWRLWIKILAAFEVGCGDWKSFRSHANLCRMCTTSRTILQQCPSCLRYFVVWSSLWNANRQIGNHLVETANADLPIIWNDWYVSLDIFNRNEVLAKNIQLFVSSQNTLITWSAFLSFFLNTFDDPIFSNTLFS